MPQRVSLAVMLTLELWGWLQFDIPYASEGSRLRITMGAVDLTREQARAGVQALLDAMPHLANAAAAWRSGRTTDDCFYNQMMSYVVIYSYEQGQDPLAAANQWISDFLRDQAAAYGPDIYADPITTAQGPQPFIAEDRTARPPRGNR
ncbi:hypothetical protein ACFY36_20365 [Actinoplanes sp. NPDC000266]